MHPIEKLVLLSGPTSGAGNAGLKSTGHVGAE